MGQAGQLRHLAIALSLSALPACSASSDDPIDGESDGFSIGKGDGAIDPASDQARALLLMVNDAAIGLAQLDDDAALHRTAALNILAHRDGPDGIAGTGDDDLFDDLAELDAIAFVGPVALQRMLQYAIDEGYLERLGDGGGDGSRSIDVVFSPQPSAQSHNARVAQLIGQAEHSIDVAMYSFSDSGIQNALAAAVARGVEVRFLFDTASEDRKLTGTALQNSKSGKLEQVGVDVRWVNKIMHHKFVIVDGPRDEADRAATARIATGSANWSNSAATKYDENTLFMTGYPELTLRMQREFDHLWNHSKDLVANPALTFQASSLAIDDAMIEAVDEEDSGIEFTSDNFVVKGASTFSTTGANTVSDAMIAAIAGATESIHVASGHLRHRGIAEALMAKQAENPEMDIRVYLDGQEFIAEATHDIQVDELQDCLAAAGTSASKQRACMDKGFLFGFQVGETGIAVRYKHYAFRWHHSYAVQMHHKYMVIDGDELWTGSFNLSDNAEHNTFENMFVFRGAQHAGLVDAFEANFAAIWETGRGEDLLSQLVEEIQTSDVIPIVYDSMALDHGEVDSLKDLIRDTCPAVNSDAFRQHPEAHFVCEP